MSSDIEIFDRVESQVRSYCRAFPTLFGRALGTELFATDGRAYIDFLSGCSSVNYGHNDPDMKQALIDYISADGIAQGLDMYTDAKQAFLATFSEIIMKPRGMDYRLQFTGPTGADAVEAALKLARKVTGRHQVISFTGGFHGMTMGALACSDVGFHRRNAATPPNGVTPMPYDGHLADGTDTSVVLERKLDEMSGGAGAPAAIIVETIQGEGNLNIVSGEWMRSIERIARKNGTLLIVDDIQAGCGRTGTFFSFEAMGVSPDIITLAKSLSGMGLPMAMVMIKPEHDRWEPAEHTGTFRGNNHAFISARTALEKFWSNEDFARQVQAKGDYLAGRLAEIASANGYPCKGRGMFRGIDVGSEEIAGRICAACFERGLVIETSGIHNEVVKVLAPLTIEYDKFDTGLDILAEAFAVVHAAPSP